VQEVELPIVEDPTNRTHAFVRNRLRHDVLPALEAASPGATMGLARAATLAQRDEAYLEARAREAAERLASAGGLDTKGLASLPFPLASRIVRRAVGEAGGEIPTLRQVEAYLALDGRDGAIHLPGGWVVENRRGALRIHRSGRRPCREGPTANPAK
jgi:tRNA(Ile)-lysidine synthase